MEPRKNVWDELAEGAANTAFSLLAVVGWLFIAAVIVGLTLSALGLLPNTDAS